MRRSGATADWRICIAGQCRPMEAYVPAEADPIVMKMCEAVRLMTAVISFLVSD